MLRFPVKSAVGACMMLATLTALPAIAQQEKALVTINDINVTESDIEQALRELDPQVQRLPVEQQRQAAVAAIIDIKLMAQKAEADGLHESEEFKRQLNFLRERALHTQVIETNVAGKITDEDIKARYDLEVANTPPTNEVKARHILVETEDAAKEIIKQLDGGADFVELAKEKSTGPSGPNGGDLGYFTPGRMVPEFDKVVFTMDVGAHSKEPVKTQFGWHVIKVDDKRVQQPPEFDSVKQQMRSVLLRERYFEFINGLKESAKITYHDETLKAPDAGQTPAASE